MTMREFPHATLRATDAYPRISGETAQKIMDAVEAMMKYPQEEGANKFSASPAIRIAVFDGPLVRWIVNDHEAQDTLERLEEALRKREKSKT